MNVWKIGYSSNELKVADTISKENYKVTVYCILI